MIQHPVLDAQAKGLLTKGVLPNLKDKEGRTGAHFAAARGEIETLQFLYSKGVDLDAEDNTGRTPLHYAALRDHESTVTFLSEKGAWIDACDATDCSPLHLAARGGSAATASRLLKLGAKHHIVNKWELTALGTLTFASGFPQAVAMTRRPVTLHSSSLVSVLIDSRQWRPCTYGTHEMLIPRVWYHWR
jgi:ankyrin repeat protein